MKNILLLFISLFSYIEVCAQQLPVYSQYMFNDFVLNPAIAGSEQNLRPIILTYRNQWLGIEQSPKTQTLSMHSPIMKRTMGVGGFLFNHTTGAIRLTGLDIAYAYHLKINRTSKLSLGLSGIIYQYVLDKSNLLPDNPTDNALQGETESTFTPDAKFGIYYYSYNYFASFSIAHLIQSKIKFNDKNTVLNNLKRHYFLMAGYKFIINDYVSIKPSFLLKAIESGIFQGDLNVNLYYRKNYWLGLSYRYKNAIVALIGFKYKFFHMGYSYDIALTDFRKYSFGSHEIMLGYNLIARTIHKSKYDFKYESDDIMAMPKKEYRKTKRKKKRMKKKKQKK